LIEHRHGGFSRRPARNAARRNDRRRRPLHAVAGLLASGLILLTLTSPALGHTTRFNSQVRITSAERVGASGSAGVHFEGVRVFREASTGRQIAVLANSDRDGFWHGTTDLLAGDYYAVAARKQVGFDPQHKRVCKRATSPVVTVP
jgi:hypothetical protein